MTVDMPAGERETYRISGAYSFDIGQQGNGVHIALMQAATGAVKEFQLARGCKDSLLRHMLSLTDVQCADWFKGANTKARKAP